MGKFKFEEVDQILVPNHFGLAVAGAGVGIGVVLGIAIIVT